MTALLRWLALACGVPRRRAGLGAQERPARTDPVRRCGRTRPDVRMDVDASLLLVSERTGRQRARPAERATVRSSDWRRCSSIRKRRSAITTARSGFSARYDGAFLVYREFDERSTATDQCTEVSARGARLSERQRGRSSCSSSCRSVADDRAAARSSACRSSAWVVHAADAKGGVETTVTKRTSLARRPASSGSSSIRTAFSTRCTADTTIGGSIALNERLTSRTTFIADYEYEHATIGTQADRFDVQRRDVGLDQEVVGSRVHVFAAGGLLATRYWRASVRRADLALGSASRA